MTVLQTGTEHVLLLLLLWSLEYNNNNNKGTLLSMRVGLVVPRCTCVARRRKRGREKKNLYACPRPARPYTKRVRDSDAREQIVCMCVVLRTRWRKKKKKKTGRVGAAATAAAVTY